MDVLQNIQRQMESEVAEIKRIENGKFILLQRECRVQKSCTREVSDG